MRQFIIFLSIITLAGCSQNPPTNLAATTPVVPAKTPIKERIFTIFVPGSDGKLRETIIKESNGVAQKRLGTVEGALETLFEKASGTIPKGTHLLGPVTKNINFPDRAFDTVWKVNLKKEFLESEIWSDSKRAKLAYDAIVKTTGNAIFDAIQPSYPVNVYVLIEGKPLVKMGSFKVTNPITP